MINIKLDPKAVPNIAEMKEKTNRAILKGMREGMFYIEVKSKELFGKPGRPRVITGHLRRSIMSKVEQVKNKFKGIIGSNVVYAAVHEFGHKRMNIPARPYIGPAIKIGQKRLEWLIQENLKQELSK